MRRSWAFKAIFAFLLGLAFGGGTLVTSTMDATQQASATPSTKTITRSATLSTANQNMWGSGAGAPTDVEITLFNETWNASDGFGTGIEEVCVGDLCTYWGFALSGSISGEIGMSLVLEGTDGGTLSVTYPVTVTFTAPADNSFDPGDEVDIETSMVVDSANAKIVASFPQLTHVGLNGVLEFAASASANLCIGDCFGGQIFSIDEDTSGEILGLDPSEINACYDPLPLGFPWLLSTYANTRCANKAYFFNPDPDVVSTLNADGTISATGQDQYAVLPVNVTPFGGQAINFGAQPWRTTPAIPRRVMRDSSPCPSAT